MDKEEEIKMRKSRFLFLILINALIFSLTGCISIEVKDIEMGKDTGVDLDWDDLNDRFEILDYVPELNDEADYYCVITGKKVDGVDIGFKEIEDPEDFVDEIVELLEDEGYEYVGDDCATNWRRCSEEEREKNNYNCLNYSLSVDEDYSRVNVYIEYFDLLYPSSHNVFLKITPETNSKSAENSASVKKSKKDKDDSHEEYYDEDEEDDDEDYNIEDESNKKKDKDKNKKDKKDKKDKNKKEDRNNKASIDEEDNNDEVDIKLDEAKEEKEVSDNGFYYCGKYICSDSELQGEQKPYFKFYKDGTVDVHLNMGDGYLDFTTEYSYTEKDSEMDDVTVTIYCNEDYGIPSEMIIIFSDSPDSCYLETDSCGLVGYDNPGWFMSE